MNIQNRTIYKSDNLTILQGINSETVDMIYLDPPFNKKKSFSAPIGSKAAGDEFKDTWFEDDIKDEWVKSIEEQHPNLYNYLVHVGQFAEQSDKAYLTYMAVRVLECRRILKQTGSIFYHCDDTMQHYIKLMLDIVFGRKNFRNEINWYYPGGIKANINYFPKKNDAIFWYTKSNEWTFNVQRKDPKDNSLYARWSRYSLDGKTLLYENFPRQDKVKFETYCKRFKSQNKREPKDGDVLYKFEGAAIDSVWADCPSVFRSKENTGYPTQKPLKLLRRIIECSTNEGDVILDPFCGCATGPVAAEQLNRKWIGVDLSIKAYSLVVERLKNEIVDLFNMDNLEWLYEVKHLDESDAPVRTDITAIQAELQTKDERRRRSLTKSVREAVYKRDKGRCVECGSKENIHYDHIIPFSKGGSNSKENLQILCAKHNLEKGNRSHS